MPSAKPARAFGASDDVLSFFSLRYATFEERLEAASAAGFAGIGLLLHHYRELREAGRSDAELAAAVASQGLAVVEIEALFGWSAETGSAQRQASDADLDVACHMAEVFGARHLQVVGPVGCDLADAAAAFGRVCDRAADVGLRVALEFLPPNDVPDFAAAHAIADAAGRGNGGVCFDVWHWFRGARDAGWLRDVAPERIVAVQWSDGPRVQTPPGQDYFADCLEHRRPCGEGDFDLAGVRALIEATGCDAPASHEVISTGLQALPHDEAAARIAAGARRLRQA